MGRAGRHNRAGDTDVSGAISPFWLSCIVGAFIFLVSIFIVHEFCVWLGLDGCGKGLRLVGYSSNEVLCFACVLIFFDFHTQFSSVIPTSYDLALYLGYGATASGWICSMTFIGIVPGSVMAKKWLNEEQGYSQHRVRSGMLMGVVIINVCLMLYVGALNVLEGRTLFWTLLGLRFMLGVGGGFPVVIGGVMAYRAIPPSQRTLFSMANTLTKNLGLILGPALSSVALQCRSLMMAEEDSPAIDEWSALERALWPAVASSFCGLSFGLFLLLATPTELAQAEEPEDSRPTQFIFSTRQAQQGAGQEVGPEQLSDRNKESMFYTTIAYQAERAFITAAVEVSTLMLLEVEFELSVVVSSYLFSLITMTSTLIIAASMLLLHVGFVSQMSIFLFSICMSGVGAVLFFNFGGIYTLLAADCLVYGFSGTAMGIAEGWGTRAATEGSSFSLAKWRMLAAVVASIVRLQAPPLARALVAYGGRNAYAIGQAAVVTFGLFTALKAARLIWTTDPLGKGQVENGKVSENEKPRRPFEAARESSCPEPSREPSPGAVPGSRAKSWTPRKQ